MGRTPHVNKVRFERAQNGVRVTVDGERVELEPSLRVRRHSPTGFEFGYAGSGPAQASLAVLLHVLGSRNTDESWKGGDAERLYQHFKFDFIASLANGEEASFEVDIEEWAEATLARRATRPRPAS